MTLLRGIVAAGRALFDLVGAVLVLIVMAPLWLLPWAGAVRVGRVYGWLAYWCWGPGRRAGQINVRRAFGDHVSRQDACRHVRAVFASMGMAIAEGIQFARRFRGDETWERLYVADDPALERALLDRPGPKIFVTGHFGSWEVALMMIGRRMGARGAAIMRRVDNPWLNLVLERLRPSGRARLIEKRGAVPDALAALRRGDSIAMLIDENGGRRGPFVPFFGRLASTRKTPALLAALTGAPIVVGAAVRREGQPLRYRLALIDAPAEHSTAAVAATTARITAVLEGWIRDDPWQWRWIHWRWRTRPDGAEETYRPRDVRAAFLAPAPSTQDRPLGTTAHERERPTHQERRGA